MTSNPPPSGLASIAHLDDLERRIVEAQNAIRARDEFLAIAAHELRSPMNAVGLQLAALERSAAQAGDPARLLPQVQRARRAVTRYVRRATMLLDVSRALSGELVPVCSHVDVATLVHEAVDTYREEAQLRGTPVEVQVQGQPAGRWDPHMVEEVLANLLSNALKYGAGSPVRVQALQADGWVCFSVADGGPGIPPESRQRIFQKFERAVHGDRMHGGFGLGLWIAARMVAAHGGSIEVDALPGGGSVFVVRLPQDTTAPAAVEERDQ